MGMPWQKLGSLWKTKKKGLLTGSLGDKYSAKIAVRENDKDGKSDKYPDYTLYLIPYDPEEGNADDGNSADEDDIPF